MLTTFKYTIFTQLRSGTNLFWVLVFPIVLSTLFFSMFGDLEDHMVLDTIEVGVIYDEPADAQAQSAADAFEAVIDALSDGEDALIAPHVTTSIDEAHAWQVDGTTSGTIVVGDDGMPTLELTPGAGDVLGMDMGSIKRTVLGDVIGNFSRSWAAIDDIAQENPRALMDSAVTEAISDRQAYTEQITVTYNSAAESVRYFYALLGFAALMTAQIALIAVSRTLPNVSALGARRCVSGTSRLATLAGSLAASWTLSFLALVIAFAYMRFVLGVDFGGRDALCVLGLGIAALMTTSLGALVGAAPMIPEGAKGGLLTGITCFLALFAGLYGSPAMELADQVAQSAPWAAAVNPVKQVTNLFYSLYVYPDLEPFFTTVIVLLVMTATFAVISGLLMRRQSYAHL